MDRLVIVSNRLPVTALVEGRDLVVQPSAGGLATGLDPVRRRLPSLWIGWPGLTAVPKGLRPKLDQELAALDLAPVEIDKRQLKGFYNELSNGIIWPLFHFLPAQMPNVLKGWDVYREVNERFADAVAQHHRPGDVIWVHDYQLALVPQLVRDRLPHATIGFFLHIPFPSSEMFRVLPWREEYLLGMLGADLVGFHTALYANNFAHAVLRTLGVEPRVDALQWDGRTVRYGAYPMGIDVDLFTGAVPQGSAVLEGLDFLRQHVEGLRILLAVDRLDYTKGIPRRLLAFEHLLEVEPALRGKVVLVQIAVPSRTDVSAYEVSKRQVEEIVGRVNGRFGTPGYQPIHYVSRGFSQEELVALYRSADVMVVTPLRDGMNLVAKEFCAARIDGDGVLVLSEFAGAAAEMGEALQVNPYDIPRTAEAYALAITMPEPERKERMRALRARIKLLDNKRWSETFLEHLTAAGNDGANAATPPQRTLAPEELAALCLDGRELVLLLDYDGTLFPIVRVPELAAPDASLLELLRKLGTRPGISLNIVSGRSKDTLEQWFGALPAGLYAEHGAWERPRGRTTWTSAVTGDAAVWKDKVRGLLEQVTLEAPGSRIEEKSSGLVWHYRLVEPELGLRKARELRFQLVESLASLPVEVMTGKRIIEVRTAGASKGAAAQRIRTAATDDALLVAIGDDHTDEEMFRGLPEGGVSVHVGKESHEARFLVPDVAAVRRFLVALDAGMEARVP